MLDMVVALGIGMSLLAYLLNSDEELMYIKAAADGQSVNIHKLAAAYWNKYTATQVPNSQWIKMSTDDKAKVYEIREQLKAYFVEFYPYVQIKIQTVRPRDIGLPLSNRVREKLSNVITKEGESLGIILKIEEQYGFIRPVNSMTNYYFNVNDVFSSSINDLTVGDVVRFDFSISPKGLCAKSIKRYDLS